MTYHTSVADALRNAARLIQEGGAQAVKLEGGEIVAETVRRLVECGIPVQGHLGLTPAVDQPARRLQGPGRDAGGRASSCSTTRWRSKQAGAFSVVLELVPAPLAKLVTEALTRPDHRHRRRPGLRRPGPGHQRHPRPGPRLRPEARQAVRPPRRPDAQGHRRVRRARSRPARSRRRSTSSTMDESLLADLAAEVEETARSASSRREGADVTYGSRDRRGAAGGARCPARLRRARADDGLSPRGAPLARPGRPAGERRRRRQHLRQPDPVRPAART